MTQTQVTYPAVAIADVFRGLLTSLTAMREASGELAGREDSEMVEIPGSTLYELCDYIARHHPEPVVIPYLVSELKRMEDNHKREP